MSAGQKCAENRLLEGKIEAFICHILKIVMGVLKD